MMANNSQGTASRSKERSKELYLQWKILLLFIVGSVLHSTFTCIMMTGCTGYKISNLQIGDAVFALIFKIATGRFIYILHKYKNILRK
jgi:hypothetical protein